MIWNVPLFLSGTEDRRNTLVCSWSSRVERVKVDWRFIGGWVEGRLRSSRNTVAAVNIKQTRLRGILTKGGGKEDNENYDGLVRTWWQTCDGKRAYEVELRISVAAIWQVLIIGYSILTLSPLSFKGGHVGHVHGLCNPSVSEDQHFCSPSEAIHPTRTRPILLPCQSQKRLKSSSI